MPTRFKKSVKIAPGVKINIGKKSAGVSVGSRFGGVSYNSKTGARSRVSAPGTGISFSEKIGTTKRNIGSLHDQLFDVEDLDEDYIEPGDLDSNGRTNLFLSKQELEALSDGGFLYYSKLVLASAKTLSDGDNEEYASSIQNEMHLINEETLRRTPKKQTFKDEAIGFRWFSLIFSVLSLSISICCFIGKISTLMGVVLAILGVVCGYLSFYGFKIRRNSSKKPRPQTPEL